MSATLGIDLSSQPAGTGLCEISWEAEHATVVSLFRGLDARGAKLDDARLLAAMRGDGDRPPPSKIGIDAPLGWPVDFVRALAGPPDAWPVAPDGRRAHLERRVTDFWVVHMEGKLPLSVSTDRIAFPAMRAAGLLAELARDGGGPIDRTGMTGRVCEVYPDPALRRLGLWPRDAAPRASYKRTARALRRQIVTRLGEQAPWLRLTDEQREACADSDDCLDALACALVARAVEVRTTTGPPSELADAAAREGWIHVPVDGALSALLG